METARRPCVDLHLHSLYSDGSDAPARVVERAHALGIAAISLTDHDTTGGLAEAKEAADALGLGFISGAELSCRHDDMSIHVLAYGFEPENVLLQSELHRLAEGRARRITEVLTRLQIHGIELARDDLGEAPENGALTRMHVARVLRERGHSRTVQRAFDDFLNPGRPAWVPSESLGLEEGIFAIHAAGGLAFLAHPCLNRRVKRSLDVLLEFPFDGIEAFHSGHSREATQRMRILAHDRGLLVSGGSDCHGMAKGKPEMGRVRTPVSCWEALEERLDMR